MLHLLKKFQQYVRPLKQSRHLTIPAAANRPSSAVVWCAFLLVSGASVAMGQDLDQQGGPIDVSEKASSAREEKVIVTDSPRQAGGAPKVGRRAAEKFMVKRESAAAPGASGLGVGGNSDAHFIAVHVGSFISDNAYQWGSQNTQTNVGRWNIGVTYRIGEWVNSMDLGIRVDGLSYALNEGRAVQLSFLPVITFPDANARFPLYFGAGIGPGVFMQQINGESALSLDYQMFAGVRFFDILDNNGFFVEAGLKNHFLLLSDGQFNGTYGAVGFISAF